jgi:hypothetical protein
LRGWSFEFRFSFKGGIGFQTVGELGNKNAGWKPMPR